MAQPSRRQVVCLCGWLLPALALRRAPAGAQGLGTFPGAADAPKACKPDEKATPAAPAGPDYRARPPRRSSLIEPGVTGPRLVLTGTVSGLTCGPIKNANVEFWQADARGAYDRAGFRLRGQQVTDATGHYRLETIVPGASGKRAPTVHVRVQPPRRSAFTTQLFFPGAPQNTGDPAFRPELAMTVTERSDGLTATFDIVLDI